MVLCLLALPVFAILGAFSIKYRKLTKDALHCLFTTATLRKCESGLDDRIKASLTGSMLKFSPRLASITYKHYKIISFLILALFIASAYFGTVGAYNYVQYGNCNGPESTGFCVFDPMGHNSGCSEIDIEMPTEITYPELESDDPIIGPADAELTIIEFGCYVCPFTAKAEATQKEVIEHYDGKVNFQFKTVIIPDHALSLETSIAANCAQDQGKYEEFHKEIFSQEITNETSYKIAQKIGLNMTYYERCMKNLTHKDEITKDTEQAEAAGIQGTPTFFINEQIIVGPKPFKTFQKIIDEELK